MSLQFTVDADESILSHDEVNIMLDQLIGDGFWDRTDGIKSNK